MILVLPAEYNTYCIIIEYNTINWLSVVASSLPHSCFWLGYFSEFAMLFPFVSPSCFRKLLGYLSGLRRMYAAKELGYLSELRKSLCGFISIALPGNIFRGLGPQSKPLGYFSGLEPLLLGYCSEWQLYAVLGYFSGSSGNPSGSACWDISLGCDGCCWDISLGCDGCCWDISLIWDRFRCWDISLNEHKHRVGIFLWVARCRDWDISLGWMAFLIGIFLRVAFPKSRKYCWDVSLGCRPKPSRYCWDISLGCSVFLRTGYWDVSLGCVKFYRSGFQPACGTPPYWDISQNGKKQTGSELG